MKRKARVPPKAAPNRRLIVIVAAAFLIGGLTALAIRERARDVEAFVAGQTQVGGPFSLVNHEGKRVSDTDFRGKYMLIAFGYTYCPDICPTELQVIANALDRLGAKADRIAPLFISVDPQRDSVKQMHDYVSNFHKSIVGLTGTDEEIKAAARVYRVFYKKETSKIDASGANYAVSHTTFIYLMGPNGEYLTHFVYGVTEEQMTAKLTEIIKD